MTKPSSENYPKHRCPWGFRNPRNHLSNTKFVNLIINMLDKGNQRITCPGCKKEVYLDLSINGHNKLGMKAPKGIRKTHEVYDDYL